MSEALRDICDELIAALAPLVDAARSPDDLHALLANLGWTPSSAVQPLLDLAQAGSSLVSIIGEDPEEISTTQVFDSVKHLANAIGEIRAQPDGAFPGGIDVASFKATIGHDLLDFILVEHLLRNRFSIGGWLKLAGLIRLTEVPSTGVRKVYLKREVAWSRIGALFTDPAKGFREVFDWNFSIPRLIQLLTDLTNLLQSYDLSFLYFVPTGDVLSFVNAGASVPVAEAVGVDLAFTDDSMDMPQGIAAGIQLLLLPPTANRGAAISLLPYAKLSGATEVALTDVLTLTIRGAADFSKGIAVIIAPDHAPEVKIGFLGGTGGGSVELQMGLKVVPPPNEPERRLIGAPDGTRFAIKSAAVFLGTQIRSTNELDVFAGLELEDAHVVIKPAADEADSFLAKLLGKDGISAKFSFGLRISTISGFHFNGSGGLETSFPLHVKLGPIEFQALSVGLKASGQGVELEAGATVSGQLGPLAVVVERAGFKLTARFPDPPTGNLGPLEMGFLFRPPNGVGLAIDAGAVKGGGYLYFDFDKGEYAGALELTVSNSLSLKAIGLINTKLPGGQSGFSLLVIITAEFNPGFQLGFGFALLGVGGLLGLNRAVLLDPLVQGVRTGAVNSILFPTNIVANAPKILSDLRAIFPPHEGTFLIGPMAKIGWGTPPLISVALGVIIEIPGNVVILGRLSVALPTSEKPVLILQVSFMGALEFDKRRIWFFATMYESRVLFITLDGEMGLLMDYSDNPNFVLAVGGFHPRFAAPPLPFPSPARIVLSIVNESWARVRAEAYFAVTSNSVQMGCRAEAFFGFDAFSVAGYFSFDALLRFSPFYLIVEISAGFSVKVFGIGLFGIHLRASLEGPTPWHIRGSAEIDILFFSFSVDVDVTFGERHTDTLPPIEVLPKMRAEFEKLESWRATLPACGQLFVSLRNLGEAEALVMHPVGTLQISQRFAPLNLTLDKIGNQTPADVKKVTVTVQAGSLAVKGPMREKFAAAQYRNMDDAAKLSAPAYEPLESGLELGAAGQPRATGPMAQRNVRYEVIIVDTAFERFRIRFFKFWDGLFTHFLAGATVSHANVSFANQQQLQPFASKVAVGEEQFAVALQSNNQAYAAGATFGSYAEAQAHLTETLRLEPALSEMIHVIPSAEVARAA